MSMPAEEPAIVVVAVADDALVPRVSRQRAVVTVIVALAVAGAVVGALWAWLAPPIHGVVALTRSGDRIHAYLGNESDNFFTAAFVFVGFLVVLSVVAAVLVWQWREHRGPVLAGALAVGCAVSAATAAGVGVALAHLRYGTIDLFGAPVTPEHRVQYVVEAPPVFFGHGPLQIATTILFPAAIAALVYALMAVSAARDDLGAWPPEETTAYPMLPATVGQPGA
ncbi:DUF2567 domain-containing protein [Mycobacterium sp. 155]|uniref:DUF2567 domain-containing protein n=1 Tax=Mycobacterium sp. 155 TaxID=1157943 RepID=UPI0003791CCD|nr:DUF2567 domain-containing protein [Mycobacterium sp. 155]